MRVSTNLCGPAIHTGLANSECLSKHRHWDMYPPCSYRVILRNVSTCQDLGVLANITRMIIFKHISNLDVHVVEEDTWDVKGNKKTSKGAGNRLKCHNFPTHFKAVELWAEGQAITTVLSFETSELIWVEEELVIEATVEQIIITEKQYTRLSKFWSKFYYGRCLFRHCWRDLWNVVPEDLLRSSVFFENTDYGHFHWGFLLPILLACFVLIVRNHVISREITEL